MAFGTDIHMEKADAGSIRGEQECIAVSCWFTSKGDTSLQLLKYQDEEGQIHTIRHIHVMSREEKHYNGIPTLEYICRIEEGGYEAEIKLLFFWRSIAGLWLSRQGKGRPGGDGQNRRILRRPYKIRQPGDL
ncbi:MAG: hypothetical protein ACLRMZ_09625 [Blautia marasmi]